MNGRGLGCGPEDKPLRCTKPMMDKRGAKRHPGVTIRFYKDNSGECNFSPSLHAYNTSSQRIERQPHLLPTHSLFKPISNPFATAFQTLSTLFQPLFNPLPTPYQAPPCLTSRLTIYQRPVSPQDANKRRQQVTRPSHHTVGRGGVDHQEIYHGRAAVFQAP